MRGRKSAGQASQRAVLRHPHPVRCAPHDFCHVSHIETSYHPQQQDFGQVGMQFASDQVNGLLGRLPIDDVLGGVVRGRSMHEFKRAGRFRATSCRHSTVVDESASGDGEGPGPKAGKVSVEVPDSLGQCQPHLCGEVVGEAWLGTAKKPQQTWLQVDEQQLDRSVLAPPSSGDDIDKRVVIEREWVLHDLSIGIASPGMSPQTSKIHPNLPRRSVRSWVRTNYGFDSALTIHGVPKRSTHMPNIGDQEVGAIGSVTFPPSASALNARSASATSATA